MYIYEENNNIFIEVNMKNLIHQIYIIALNNNFKKDPSFYMK